MQNPLVETKGKKVVTDSLRIAEKANKSHDFILRKIRSLMKDDEKDILNFAEISYQDSYGRDQKKYVMDRKSFSILCMRFTGKKALIWQSKFYDAFENMETFIKQQILQSQNPAWVAQRESGKIIHREKTDTIKDFVDYAFKQGSSNAKMYYSNIARMENKALFILEQKFPKFRDILNLNQLSTITSADTIAKRAIIEGMKTDLHYKDIYQLAKKRVETFAEIHGKTFIPTTQIQIS